MMRYKAEIIREYGPFPDIKTVGGVSYDGQKVWMANGTELNSFDPEGGRILGGFAMAAEAGTAFDGTHLFQIADSEIRKIDPTTGEILSSIPAPGAGGDSGLAWAEGSLWVGEHRGCKIHQVNPDTGQIVRTIQSDRFVTGVTWVEGELWHGTWQEDRSDIRHIDPVTGEVYEVLDMPPGTAVSGLESDGGDRFFCGGGNSPTIRVVKKPMSAK